MKVSKALGLKVQELSHDEVRQKLQAEVDKLDEPEAPQPGVLHYVRDVYDDYFVYEARSEGEPPKLFKQGFTVDDQNNVQLAGEPEEVIEETQYVAAEAQEPTVNEEATEEETPVDGEPETQEKEVDTMREKQVDALITCEQNTWCEDDREFLMNLDDDKFAKIEALAAPKEEEPVAEEVVEETATPEPETPEVEEEVVEEEPAAEEPKVQTLDDLLANADQDLRESIEQGQRMLRQQKDELVTGILAIKTNKFTEEQLRAKSMDELTALAELGRVEVDFSGKGGGEIDEPVPVPPAPRMVWNKDGTPNYDHLSEEK